VADSTGALYLWDLRSDRDDSLLTEVELSEYVVHVEIDQTGRQCAAVTNRGHLFIWNIHSGTLAQVQQLSSGMESEPEPFGKYSLISITQSFQKHKICLTTVHLRIQMANRS
jgi:hypothetical protein